MKRSGLFLISLILLVSYACNTKVHNSINTNLSASDQRIEQKIDSILSLMTLEEKIGQMTQYSGGFEFTGPTGGDVMKKDEILAGRVGSMLNVIGAKDTREYQKAAVEDTRLGIPLIFGYDVIHGFKTIFPVPLGEAASWDLDAIEKSAHIAAVEASAAGVHWTFAPMVDIARDPRWGRVMEGAGEDTYYGSLVAKARVKGFQGADLAADSTVVACAKHFAAYGAAEGGRDYNTTDMSIWRLNEIYLPPFKAALDAGAGTFMNSFNDLNGMPATGNQYLVHKTLKKDWQFDGFVVSDWGSIGEMKAHGVAADDRQAAKLAIENNCDMDMESRAYKNSLADLVKSGEVDEQLLNDAVRRILRIKFRLGLFDDPFRYCSEERENKEILSPAHREAAREIARKSIVLLKNEGNILPLKKDLKRIAVIGPLADSQKDIIGSWSAKGDPKDAIPLLKGIQDAVGPNSQVVYAKGCDITGDDLSGFAEAINLAKGADVVVAAVGESASMTGEASSRGNIGLPGVQQELLKALKNTGKPVVAVLMNGRPLVLSWLDKNIPSILETWFLGTEAGPAIADVLFGDYNPSGKLPISFPYDVGQIPVYYNHFNTGRPATDQKYTSRYLDIPNEPLYPFGYGLSYTDFEFSDITLDKTTLGFDDALKISVNVKNSGSREGEEVVQLYIRDLVGSLTRPVKELKGFQKITLAPGATKSVEFMLTANDLRFYNANMEFKAEPGDFKVFIGPNSADVKSASFVLK